MNREQYTYTSTLYVLQYYLDIMCCLINSFILNSKPPVSIKVIYKKFIHGISVILRSPVVSISFSEQVVKMIVELIELKLIT